MIIGQKAKPSVPPVNPGTYMAICVAIYELGEQQLSFKGKTRYAQKIQFVFEIPEERIEIDGEDKARQLSRTFNVSTSKASELRKFISSWLGKTFTDEEFKAFDTDTLLRKNAMIQVVLNDTGEYANIDTIMSLPKGVKASKPEADPIIFKVDEWDDALFETLPDWVKEKLMNSTEFQDSHAPTDEVDFPEEQPKAEQPREKEEGVPF
ncbi:MAG: hypothetical protein IJ088_08300 [Clostridia bacterium]|nr:hypothetical protein [Clostridia bacterium]